MRVVLGLLVLAAVVLSGCGSGGDNGGGGGGYAEPPSSANAAEPWPCERAAPSNGLVLNEPAASAGAC